MMCGVDMGTPKQLDVVRSFSSVLLIRLNDIGEVVMTLPCLDAVRRALPGARIGMLVSPPSHELLEHDERVNQVFIFEKKLWRERPSWRGVRQLSGLLRDLRKHRFDVSIDLQNTPSTHWLAWASGARFRTAVESQYSSRRVLSWRAPIGNGWDRLHNVERHFHLLSSVGLPTRGAKYQFAFDPNAKERVAASLQEELDPAKPCIVFQPGAGLPERCWPVSKFAGLADRLMQELGAQIIVHCGPNEDHLGERIHREVSKPVILARRLTLQELAGLLSLCDLLVSNDSGPMHLAAAIGTPVVAVFGSTDPGLSGPYAGNAEVVSRYEECSPCGIQKLACTHRKCLTELRVEDVYIGVRRLLRKKNESSGESSEVANIQAS